MTTNTADRAVIGFTRGYSKDKLEELRLYTIQDGGMRISKPVGVSSGSSTEFFLVKTVDRIEAVREATAVGSTAAKRFMELKKYLRGDTLESYKKLVADTYPKLADKTNAYYKEPVWFIPTGLGNHPYPGNMMCHAST